MNNINIWHLILELYLFLREILLIQLKGFVRWHIGKCILSFVSATLLELYISGTKHLSFSEKNGFLIKHEEILKLKNIYVRYQWFFHIFITFTIVARVIVTIIMSQTNPTENSLIVEIWCTQTGLSAKPKKSEVIVFTRRRIGTDLIEELCFKAEHTRELIRVLTKVIL